MMLGYSAPAVLITLAGTVVTSIHLRVKRKNTSQRLTIGARVTHPLRGAGTITEVDLKDSRNKPYKVQFDNNEYHAYSEESSAKLQLMRSSLFGSYGIQVCVDMCVDMCPDGCDDMYMYMCIGMVAATADCHNHGVA